MGVNNKNLVVKQHLEISRNIDAVIKRQIEKEINYRFPDGITEDNPMQKYYFSDVTEYVRKLMHEAFNLGFVEGRKR